MASTFRFSDGSDRADCMPKKEARVSLTLSALNFLLGGGRTENSVIYALLPARCEKAEKAEKNFPSRILREVFNPRPARKRVKLTREPNENN